MTEEAKKWEKRKAWMAWERKPLIVKLSAPKIQIVDINVEVLLGTCAYAKIQCRIVNFL